MGFARARVELSLAERDGHVELTPRDPPSIQSSRNSKLMAAAPATVLLAVGNAAALVVLVLLLGGGSPHRPFLAQPTAERRCPAVQVGLRFGVF